MPLIVQSLDFMAASRLLSSISAPAHWFIPLVLLIGSTGMWGSTPLEVQGQVSLTLNYHESVENEGTLPADTEVLVLVRDGSSAESLSDVDLDGSNMGERSALREALTERATTDPENTYDTLDDDGQTKTIQLPGREADRNVIAYVLALVPDDADGDDLNRNDSNADTSLYESRVGGERVENGPGFDFVVTGNMDMISVTDDDTEKMNAAFGEAVEAARYVRPVLHDIEGNALSSDTKVRIWEKDDIEDSETSQTLGGRAEFYQGEPDKTRTIDESGKLSERLARTWHSEVHYYILAETPQSTFYETHSNGAWVHVAVEELPLQLTELDEEAAEAAAAAFGGDTWSWWVLILGGVLGGLLLLAGGAIVWKKFTSSKRDPKPIRDSSRQPGNKTGGHKGNLNQGYGSTDERKPGNIVEAESGIRAVPPGQDTNSTPISEKEQAVIDELPKDMQGHLREAAPEMRELVVNLYNENQKLKERPQKSQSPNRDEEITSREKGSIKETHSKKREGSRKPISEKVGDVFVSWCQDSPPALLNKYSAFANQLKSDVSGAEFSRIYRDRDSHETVFGTDVQDPIEYWLVKVKGRSFLLPQPSRNDFYELGDSFDGPSCSPNQVTIVQPAELKKRGHRYVLQKKGRIA